MNTCVKCACIAAALIAAGCSKPKYGYGVTREQVECAKQALCDVGEFDSGEALARAAAQKCGNQYAVGVALNEHLQCGDRIAELLHQHPDEPEGS